MKLPRRCANCSKCEKKFDFGDTYFSQVEGEQRRDFCENCSKPVGEFWQGKIPPKKERSYDERAINLFRKREDFRYLLALYLERRREIAYRAQLSKKGLRCYELLETGELFYVPIGTVKKEAIDEVAKVLDEEPSR
ncbi:MAG: hypothetical protein S4CHLAM81_12530 [Chlamydiales bacterium]|nr:hypothetical protein [Chlamydiales bacterium]MCH9636028.1 hypothetical protein [Chlamydiales bacterium]MCH9703600.1 hypothetical protein [Chlamydiota bacterium]